MMEIKTKKNKRKRDAKSENYQALIPLFSAINVHQSLLQYSQAVPISSVVMASVQLQKPVEIPQAQAQAPTLPFPAIQTHSLPSEQQASSIQTSQKGEEKHVGSNIVEGVKELLHIEQSSTKTEHAEKPLACAKEGAIGGIVAEKKKKDKKEKDKDKKDKDKKEKDKHAKNNEDGRGATICKSPKTHDKKEKKKGKNKDDDSSDDDARSKAKKLDKEKKKHK